SASWIARERGILSTLRSVCVFQCRIQSGGMIEPRAVMVPARFLNDDLGVLNSFHPGEQPRVVRVLEIERVVRIRDPAPNRAVKSFVPFVLEKHLHARNPWTFFLECL